ncbi:Dabb family protein [Arthrobacter sp. GMC3]|uniref:Dabb family protein n=1 Tax=Arthrobacter sp. GMC3 TaxID=2058894 RepID=UPI000CE47F57|nr:Dabb family protein [Arthrobacter sp. GMC3]
MIHHVVSVRLLPDTNSLDVQNLCDTLSGLAATLDGVVSYAIGTDLRLRDGNDDLAIVGAFADSESLHRYLSHPEHLAVLAKFGPRCIAEKHSVQFESTDRTPE